jgi:predicted DNA-binding protein with PD1-like motif
LFVISVKPGEEVMESLTRQLEQQGVQRGAIVSLIGAIDACCISNMPKHDATDDNLAEYQQPCELSGTGEIADGKPHIHCVLSTEGDHALAGHLHWARVETHFVNAYVVGM